MPSSAAKIYVYLLTRHEHIFFCFKILIIFKISRFDQRKRNPRGTSSRRCTFSNQLDSFQAPGLERHEGKTGFRLPASSCVKALPGKAFHRVAPGIVFEVTMRSPLLEGAWGSEPEREASRSQQGEAQDVLQEFVAIGLR